MADYLWEVEEIVGLLKGKAALSCARCGATARQGGHGMPFEPPKDVTRLKGKVELVDGKLTLQIPLAVGGDKLATVRGAHGQIDGDFLVVVIKPWLAEKLRIEAGSIVQVDNANGTFSITRHPENDARGRTQKPTIH